MPKKQTPFEKFIAKNPIFGYVLVGAILVLVFGGGLFYLQARQDKNLIIPPLDEESKDDGQVCVQVITPAKNPQTGEVRDFPTPCDVPEGWMMVDRSLEMEEEKLTYINFKYDYAFEYPADHIVFREADQANQILKPATENDDTVKIVENENTIFCCEPNGVSFSIVKQSTNVKTWLTKNYKNYSLGDEYSPVVETEFAGVKVALAEDPSGGNIETPFRVIAVNRNGVILVIVQDLDTDWTNEIMGSISLTE